MKNKKTIMIQNIINGNWTEKVEAADALVNIQSPEVLDSLIALLKSNDAEIRNASALALREMGNSIAVVPLIKAIKKTENHNNISTLVYALETLNCANHFIDIFDLVVSDKGDVQMAALNIFFQQGFMVDDNDVLQAKKILKQSRIREVDKKLYISLSERLNDFM